MNTTNTHPKADANGWVNISPDSMPDMASMKKGVFLTNRNMEVPGLLCTRLWAFGGSFSDAAKDFSPFTHWRPYDLPSPVARKTQREIDEEAAIQWTHAISLPLEQIRLLHKTWHASLAWERSRKK